MIRRTKRAMTAHAEKMDRKRRHRAHVFPQLDLAIEVYNTGVKRGGPGGTRIVYTAIPSAKAGAR